MNNSANEASKPVILAVDDCPSYLSVLGAMLEPGYTVRVAGSGQRALQLAMQEPRPDLVLLDVVMPDMDGHAVLRALRADDRTRDIPVIFFTSMDEPGSELACLAQGAADYIVKPGSPEIVNARVRTQVELKRTRDRLQHDNEALQREIHHRAELEERLQATIADLEAFSYSVSHDLRSPLSAISTFAGTLVETESKSMSPQGRHRLDRIVAGSSRMNRMIDDILACSRAERADMLWRDVDLRKIAEEVVDEMRVRWPKTRVTIGDLPCVRGDATMLRQVMANLIGNAMKFSGGSAHAQVQVEACDVDGQPHVRVRDNGVGFDVAYASKLFGLFQRLHGEAEFPGSGVGLAIVKRLLSRHGATVQAESVPGGWTTFSFPFEPAEGARTALRRCGVAAA